MGKLPCRCGHVIVNQTDFLPYKAQVVSDQDSERVWDAPSDRASGFLEQRSPEARRRWSTGFFNGHYPGELAGASVVHDILNHALLRLGRTMYECESCGRLWLQSRPDRNHCFSYAPGEPGTIGVLRSIDEA